jgi:hypothetical protein
MICVPMGGNFPKDGLVMPTGWKLRVQRGDRIEHYIAQAPDRHAAIAAVRRKRGMKDATIFVMSETPNGDLTWLGLKDGDARRIAGG